MFAVIFSANVPNNTLKWPLKNQKTIIDDARKTIG